MKRVLLLMLLTTGCSSSPNTPTPQAQATLTDAAPLTLAADGSITGRVTNNGPDCALHVAIQAGEYVTPVSLRLTESAATIARLSPGGSAGFTVCCLPGARSVRSFYGSNPAKCQ